MRVQCDRCGSSYTLPEERVAPGRRLQFQCRHCQHRIVVSVPELAVATVPQPMLQPSPLAGRGAALSSSLGASNPLAASPILSSAPPAGRVLWFVGSPAGQQQRMDTEGLRAAIADGTVTRDNWVWKKGMAEWQRAADCLDFIELFTHADARSAPTQNDPQPTLASHVVELSRPAVVTGSHVAGTASVHKGSGHNTDQRALALPIIRVGDASDPSAVEPIRKDAPLRRPSQPAPRDRQVRETRNESRSDGRGDTRGDTRGDGRGDSRGDGSLLRTHASDRDPATAAYDTVGPDDDDKNKWSPATDTYTGQKARLTRRVDDRDRNAAVEWADTIGKKDQEHEQLQAQVRAWQRLAIAAVTALGIVLLVALIMTVKWRDAANNLEQCQQKLAPHRG